MKPQDWLCLDFGGWFQCRHASDPDPSDEPRGVSGYSFAVAGEEDFDKVIRFHGAREPRSHCPEVGVRVISIALRRGAGNEPVPQPEHPLLGGKFDLLGDPIFAGYNGVIAEGTNLPIDPFHIQVSKADLFIERSDCWDPDHPDKTVFDASVDQLRRRQPIKMENPFEPTSDSFKQATGIREPTKVRPERRLKLENDLEAAVAAGDDTLSAALRTRVADLRINHENDRRLLALSYQQHWEFAINGTARVEDRRGLLPEKIVTEGIDWPIRFWMGAWDCDALCGYVAGTLEVPSTTG